MQPSLALIRPPATQPLKVNWHVRTALRYRLRRLPAQESRDFKLVFLGRIMHRSLSSERVEPLMAMPFTVLGGHRTLSANVVWRPAPGRDDGARRLDAGRTRPSAGDSPSPGIVATPEPDRCEPLQQTDPALFGQVRGPRLTTNRPQLVLSGIGRSSSRGIGRPPRPLRSGVGGMKASSGGSSSSESSGAGSNSIGGLGAIGRIVTSSVPPSGSTAAATAARAADSIASVLGAGAPIEGGTGVAMGARVSARSTRSASRS